MTAIKDERGQQQSFIPVNSTSSSKSHSHSVMTSNDYHQLSQLCTCVLNYLLSFEISGPFIMPVPQNYQMYYKQVEQPMDLTTLECNILSQQYTNYQEFERHLSLVWRNAMEYHQQHTLIYKKATMLQQLYDVFKRDLDLNLKSVTSIPVEIPQPQKQLQSESEPDHSDLYMVAAVSPQESPLMVQHYENFAYARPTYDELHAPLFHQLLDEISNHPQKTVPYPRLYISGNRLCLNEALEKQVSSTFTILWNTRFDDLPPPSTDTQRHQSNLVVMTTHVTHGIPYRASLNTMRSPSSYSVSTPTGVSTTSDSDYAPQLWIKCQPTHTFRDVKMVISTRMEDAFFSRAYAIQPVSSKVGPPAKYPKQPWISNSIDTVLIERMKQCLKSGESDVSILDQDVLTVTSTERNTGNGTRNDSNTARQQSGNGDHPIVISDDDDGNEHDTVTTTTVFTGHGEIHPERATTPIAIASALKMMSPAIAKDSNDNLDHDPKPTNSHVLEHDGNDYMYRRTAPTDTESSSTMTSSINAEVSSDIIGHDMTLSTCVSTSPVLEHDRNNIIDLATTSTAIELTTKATSPMLAKDDYDGTSSTLTKGDHDTTYDADMLTLKRVSLELTKGNDETPKQRHSISSTLLDVMNKLREYARSKGVGMVNVNSYKDSTSPKADVEGHFKSVYYLKNDKTLTVLTFRRMTTVQRVNEIVSLLKVKGEQGMANIVDILYADGDEDSLTGFTMDRYQYTLKNYIQWAQTHHHLTPHQKMDIIQQMLKSLQCIHENGIGHRDLSEGNIMVDLMPDSAPRLADGSKGVRVRLIDFGKAVFTTPDDARQWWTGPTPLDDDADSDTEVTLKTQAELDEWCGHLPLISTYPDHSHRCYRSIQTLPRTQKDAAKLPWLINPMAEDVYSVGVLIWKVFTDKVPWNGVMERNLTDLHVMVKDDAAIELQVGRGVSGELSQLFLLKCLRAHHIGRLSARELLKLLDTPYIAQGMLDEWATFYSSTSTRSRRTAAATRFQNEQARSSLPKALQKRKKQQGDTLETGRQRIRSKRHHVDVGHTAISSIPSLLDKEPATANPSSSSSTMRSSPSIPAVKTRSQIRKIAATRSTSPHLISYSSSSTSPNHSASISSSPKPTVHIPSTSSSSQYLPSTPPPEFSSLDDHEQEQQQQQTDSTFFTTNVAKNPYLFLISYPPSNIRAQERNLSTSQPSPPFTQQHLTWMYDLNHNLKLPSLGLNIGGSSSTSSIFGESDSELTPAPTTDTSQASSPVVIGSAIRLSHKEGDRKAHGESMHDGNRRVEYSGPSIAGSKRKAPSSLNENGRDDKDSHDNRKTLDHAKKRTITAISGILELNDISRTELGSAYNNSDTLEQNTHPTPTIVKIQASALNRNEESYRSTDVDGGDDNGIIDDNSDASNDNRAHYYDDGDDDDDNEDDDGDDDDDDDDDDDYVAQGNTSPTLGGMIRKRGRPLGSKTRKGAKPLGRPPGRVNKRTTNKHTSSPSIKATTDRSS